MRLLTLIVSLALATNVALAQSPTAQRQDDTAQVATDTAAAEPEQEELVRARAIADSVAFFLDTIQTLVAVSPGLTAEERDLERLRIWRFLRDMRDQRDELLGLLRQLDTLDLRVDSLVQAVQSNVASEIGLFDAGVDYYVTLIATLRGRRSSTSEEDLADLESDLRESKARFDTVLAGQIRALEVAEAVGLDVTEEWEAFDRFLVNRIESQVGRLQIADIARDRLRSEIRDAERAGTAEDAIATLRARLRLADQRVAGTVGSLRASADLLDRRGIETAQYRRVIIEATGELTGDILNVRVFFGVLGEFLGRMWRWIQERSPTVVVRILIVIASIILFRLAFRVGWRLSQRAGRPVLSQLLRDLVERLLRPTATVLGILAGLWFIGVNPATLLAGVGVIGLIIGLALQDSMSNLAAGFFILMYRPYDVEDIVNAGGVVGKVRAMGLANTTVVTFDNRVLFVPNRKIWSEIIENRSAQEVRRVETIVKVSYREELDRVCALLIDTVKANERVLKEPAPSAFVSVLGDPWIDVKVWAWVATENWWTLTKELPRAIRVRFEAEGIETPAARWVWPARPDSEVQLLVDEDETGDDG